MCKGICSIPAIVVFSCLPASTCAFFVTLSRLSFIYTTAVLILSSIVQIEVRFAHARGPLNYCGRSSVLCLLDSYIVSLSCFQAATFVCMRHSSSTSAPPMPNLSANVLICRHLRAALPKHAWHPSAAQKPLLFRLYQTLTFRYPSFSTAAAGARCSPRSASTACTPAALVAMELVLVEEMPPGTSTVRTPRR